MFSSNGTNGVNGDIPHVGLQWKVGLINSESRYLTAERFGNRINASGSTLKKNQVWTLEHDQTEEVVYLRSHQKTYISTDKHQQVLCEKTGEERGLSERWIVEYDGSGRWAFRNAEFGSYLGGTEDNLRCKTTPEWWTIQLDIHPQVNMRNLNRKKYAILNDDQLQCSELIPWREVALVIMEFKNGNYALKSIDNRYLHKNGDLVESSSVDTIFMLEIRSGQNSGVAFKSVDGKYLTAVGQKATILAKSTRIGRDEIFTFEDSHPQATVTSILTGKRTTVKQGLDLTSVRDNDEPVEPNEIFQIEFDVSSSKWALRSFSNQYWTVEKSGIQLSSKQTSASFFDLDWQDDGSVMLKASNDRYVFAMGNGSLKTSNAELIKNSDTLSSAEYRFRIVLINRPLLVLKGMHGFVGFRYAGKQELACNKGNYDLFVLIPGNQSGYYVKANEYNKYWTVGSDGSLSASSDKPIRFQIEFHKQSHLAIRAQNGLYVTGESNGNFAAKATEITSAALWEY